MDFETVKGARDACVKLDGAEMSTYSITAFPRRRSIEGRWTLGFGPDGGIKDRGKTVVLQGVPQRMSVAAFTEVLRKSRYEVEEVSGKAVEVVNAAG
jgi:hypothetical protein